MTWGVWSVAYLAHRYYLLRATHKPEPIVLYIGGMRTISGVLLMAGGSNVKNRTRTFFRRRKDIRE